MRQRHETHVVVIQRVRGRAVRQGRIRPARAPRRPQHPARPLSVLFDDALDDSRRRLGGAGEGHTDRVEQRARGRDARRDRRLGRRDEIGKGQRDAPCVAVSGLPMAAMNRCLMNTQSSGGLAVGADS